MNFIDIKTDEEYEYKINNMIDINAYNISEDHRNLIIPDIIEFIKFIKHM